MKAIYEPRGPAREYADLAANLYRGCGHGCRYCYAPSILRQTREQFSAAPAPRKGILDALRKDAMKFAGTDKRVLLSFTSDPYQPIEFHERITRQAIVILGRCNIPIRILTKRPEAAIIRDGELLAGFDVEFGTTLCFTHDGDRLQWEPGAETVDRRMRGMKMATAAGLSTWLSIEPVIDPDQALGVIRATHESVDVFKIGKLNHDKEREALIDWREFLASALFLLKDLGAGYYIKDALWDFSDDAIRASYPRTVATGNGQLATGDYHDTTNDTTNNNPPTAGR